jgi:4-aminobutyrate aminotransferase-like enzyme
LAEGLKALTAKHGCIGEVRGLGLMQGIEFVADRTSREPAGDLVHRLERMAFSKGLLVLAAGKNALRLAPPLVVDDADVDIALEILEQCLSELD